MEGYEEQFWENENPESQVNATRMTHIEKGIKNAYNVSLIAITNIQPSECNEGDKYFNTNDNLIYTATGTDTWSIVGETPISDKTYVLVEDGSTYAYNGTTLARIGGSPPNVDEYSTSETNTNKVWIDNKPIYRKVINFGSLPDNDTTFFTHNLPIDTPLRIFGYAYNQSINGKFTLPWGGVNMTVDKTSITVGATSDRSAWTATFIIEYTKAEDE